MTTPEPCYRNQFEDLVFVLATTPFRELWSATVDPRRFVRP